MGNATSKSEHNKNNKNSQKAKNKGTKENKDFNSTQTSNNETIPEYNNRHLSIYLIKNIFSYIDKKTLFQKNYITLNKQLFGLFNLKAIQIKKESNHSIGGSQDMNTVYSEYDLDQICSENKVGKNTLKNIFFEIESKDQGWASVRESSSFVILRIVDKENKKTVLKQKIIVKNFKEQNFKNTKIDLKQLLREEFNDYLNDLSNKNTLLQIVGKSEFPGWLCYIRKCNAKFNLLSIDH